MKAIIISLIMFLLFMPGAHGFSNGNLIKNPSFEEVHNKWASLWYIRSLFEWPHDSDYIYETDPAGAHSGQHYITVKNNVENDARIYQIIKVKPLTVYKLSGWIKAEGCRSDRPGGTLSIPDSYISSKDMKDTNGEWRYVEVFGITGEYQTRMPVALRLGGWTGQTTGTVSFDDVSLEQVMYRSAGVAIESFSFYDSANEEIIQNYFNRINSQRFSSHTMYISFLFAILVFLASIFFTFYSIALKEKIPKLDTALSFTFKKLYYILIAVFFVVFFIVFIPRANGITMYDTQFSFLIVLVLGAGITAYLYKQGNLTPKNIAAIMIILGIALRLCYFIYTDQATRQHDLWGAWDHTEYIRYMASHYALPDVGTYEAYHPPIHYFLSSIIYNISRLFKLNDIYALRSVELLMVFFSSLSLILIHKILSHIKLNDMAILTGMAFACFLPSFVYMSVFLNNDTTVTLFYLLSFYFLVKWVSDKSMKNVILLALFTAIALLTKKSAMVILPVHGITFIVELIKDTRAALSGNRAVSNKTGLGIASFFRLKKDKDLLYKKYLVQGLVFLAIAIPLGFSYQIRNFIVFQQDLSYAVAPLGTIMPNNPYKLFFVSVNELLKNPFVSFAPHENDFFLQMLIKTTLFDVFQFKEQIDISVAMMALHLVTLVILVLNIVLVKKEHLKGHGYIFLINLVSTLVSYLRMRFYSPYDCTQAFRYILPFIIVSLAFYAGSSYTRFTSTRFPALNWVLRINFWVFCILSIIFILQIGPPV